MKKHLTVRELAEKHPEIRGYDYKWRNTETPETEKDLEEVLRDLGYKFIHEEDKCMVGEYNDLKGYLNCAIEQIN